MYRLLLTKRLACIFILSMMFHVMFFRWSCPVLFLSSSFVACLLHHFFTSLCGRWPKYIIHPVCQGRPISPSYSLFESLNLLPHPMPSVHSPSQAFLVCSSMPSLPLPRASPSCCCSALICLCLCNFASCARLTTGLVLPIRLCWVITDTLNLIPTA